MCHGDVDIDLRRLPPVSAAELVLPVNDHTKKVVQLEPGDVKGEVVVVEVPYVVDVLKVPDALEVRYKL